MGRAAAGGWRRAARGLVLIVIVMLALPFAVAPFYRFVNPVSTLMLGRRVTGAPVERVWVPLDTVAPVAVLTVVAAEDAGFCAHHGIAWEGLREAIDDASDGVAAPGRSTITQQVAKNLFLWPGRSYIRKAIEVPLALWIDLVLPKRRILEIYLNIAEWGPGGQFGLAAGARRAFGKGPAELTPGQAALLAAMLPNPSRRDARAPGRGLQRLAGRYQARARSQALNASCLHLGPRP